MASEKLIHWKMAAERGLKPIRTLDLRVEPHRDSGVFFIQELVEYDTGKRGWRRRTGEGYWGKPFTYKFRTAVEAEAEVSSIRFEAAVNEADAALRDEIGIDYIRRDNLKRLWEHTARDPGKLPTAGELVALFREQRATIADALDAIRAQGGEQQPKDYELMWAFKEGRRSATELVAWWRERLDRKEAQRVSTELKERKKKERAERRVREDAFLRDKAAEKAAADGVVPPVREELSLVGHAASESVLEHIAAKLCEKPYLRHVLMYEGGYLRLYISENRLAWKEWGQYETYERKRRIAERAVIADAFGMDPTKDDWHKVRSALLTMLKPSNLDMLHRKDVQAALEKARAAGRTLVVIRHQAFLWDEEVGEWLLREVERSDGATSPGYTLWAEGPIESANYGRIIVLPYLREDGTKVVGHTRNAAYQGKAEPRAETKIIRFAVYDELDRDDTWDHYGNEIVPDDEGNV